MSNITITGFDFHILEGPRPWAIVRVQTDVGIEGVGEIPRTNQHPKDIARRGEQLIGSDPFETERLFGVGGSLNSAPNNIYEATISGGFDMACWDIKGRYFDVPVYELLGGKIRDTIRVYANGWDFDARNIINRYHEGENEDSLLAETKEEISAKAKRVADADYTALKFSPFLWGDGATTTAKELDYAFEVINEVYETVPSDVELLIEGHKQLSTEKALQAARRLEKFHPGFYEEPVPAEVGPLRKIARKSPVPIATGESFSTHRAFTELIFNTDVSVVQPDVGRAGGITELQKIAAMASSEHVGFAPHNAGGPVMTHAAVQVDAVTPAFMIQETFEEFFHPEWSKDLIANPLTIRDGVIEVPERPGLGVEIDMDVLEEHDIKEEFH